MIIFFEKRKPMIIWLLIVLMGTELCWEGQICLAEENLSMYSQSYALMDGDTGRILNGWNQENPMANASTTKILTCIIALEHCNLDECVTISAYAASQPKVRWGMKDGQQYSLRELLYGLMLESYNDCAVAIAEHVGGTVEKFSELMNRKAKEIGCTDTFFITPNGLDQVCEENYHHSTASDLCRIMAYCVWESPQKEKFLEITQTKTYHGFVNRNRFLDQMEGVISGKTGYTSKAGYCYVAAFEQDGERYCIALLACGWPGNNTYRWQDARILLDYGRDNYNKHKVQGDRIEKYWETLGYASGVSWEDLNGMEQVKVSGNYEEFEILSKEGEQIRTEIRMESNPQLPVKQGQILGECDVYIEEHLLFTVKLQAEEDYYPWNLGQIFRLFLEEFLSFCK